MKSRQSAMSQFRAGQYRSEPFFKQAGSCAYVGYNIIREWNFKMMESATRLLRRGK